MGVSLAALAGLKKRCNMPTIALLLYYGVYGLVNPEFELTKSRSEVVLS